MDERLISRIYHNMHTNPLRHRIWFIIGGILQLIDNLILVISLGNYETNTNWRWITSEKVDDWLDSAPKA